MLSATRYDAGFTISSISFIDVNHELYFIFAAGTKLCKTKQPRLNETSKFELGEVESGNTVVISGNTDFLKSLFWY